jgi:hypothetical protein
MSNNPPKTNSIINLYNPAIILIESILNIKKIKEKSNRWSREDDDCGRSEWSRESLGGIWMDQLHCHIQRYKLL